MPEQRRALIEGLTDTPPPPVDAAKAKDFIYKANTPSPQPAPTQLPPALKSPRIHYTLRMRLDLVQALKHASLRRELEGAMPHTVQDIVEQLLEPWLKAHGYLP